MHKVIALAVVVCNNCGVHVPYMLVAAQFTHVYIYVEVTSGDKRNTAELSLAACLLQTCNRRC